MTYVFPYDFDTMLNTRDRGAVADPGSITILKAPYRLNLAASSADADATAEINAAIVYATDQGRTVLVDDTYQVDGVLLQSFTRIEQSNPTYALRQKDSGTGGAAVATVSLATPEAYGNVIADVHIDGNRSNQSVAIHGLYMNSGATVNQGGLRRWQVLRPIITSTKGDGLKVDFYGRDSLFDGVQTYFCDGRGIAWSGSDSRLINFNVGQSLSNGIVINGSDTIISNGKAWGSGRYGTSSGLNGIANFLFQVGDVEASNLVSQESTGRGFYWFLSGNSIDGFTGVNLVSDGDQIATGASANGCFEGFNLINSRIEGTIKKASAGLAGTPQTFVKLGGTSTDNIIRVSSPESLLLAGTPISGNGTRNDIEFNGAKGKLSVDTFAASYTPILVSRYNHSTTLTADITVNAPAIAPPIGAVVRFTFIQDGTGNRSITFNAVYLVQATWVPNLAAAGVSVISFYYDGTSYVQTSPYVGTPIPVSVSSNRTAVANDVNTGVIFTGGAANYTLNTGLGIAVGQTIRVILTGSGPVTFVAGTATVTAVSGSTLVSTAGIADCYVTCVAANTYVVGGSLV